MMNENSTSINMMLDFLGSKTNIKQIADLDACLQFTVKDEQKVELDKLRLIRGINDAKSDLKTIQIKLDNKDEFFKELIETLKFSEDGHPKKQGVIEAVTNFIGDVIMPVLPLITFCGILKGPLVMALAMHIINPHGGLYITLYAIGDSVFYFLPVFLGYTTAKRMGVTPFVGALVGTILIYPTITDKHLNFFGIVSQSKYTSSFLPVILIVFLMAPLYIWLQHKLPQVLKGFGPGLITLSIAMPIGLVIVGPASNLLADALGFAIRWFYDLNPIIAGIVIGATWIYITLYGLFGIVISVVVINIFNGTGDLTLAVSIFVTLACAGSALGVGLKTKAQQKRDVAYPAAVSAIFGVIQPAIYGLFIEDKKLMRLNVLIGAVVGGLAGLLGIRKYAMGSGIFGLPTMLNQVHPNILQVFGLGIVSFALGFVVTLVLFRDNKKKNNEV